EPQQPTTITMGASTALEGGLQRVRDYAGTLEANGGTAIYSSIADAYRFVQSAAAHDSLRYYSIVLMTDRESNAGLTAAHFREFYQSLPPAARRVKVFPSIFGEAKQQELASIAELTGGRLFDGSKTALAPVFKEIRGYQ